MHSSRKRMPVPRPQRRHHDAEFFEAGAKLRGPAVREERARPVLDAHIGGSELAEQRAEVATVQRDRVVDGHLGDVDVVSLHRPPSGLGALAGPVGHREPAGSGRHAFLGVGERRLLVLKLELAHRREQAVADLVHDEPRPRVLLAVSPHGLPIQPGNGPGRRYPAHRREPRPRRSDHRIQVPQAGAEVVGRAVRRVALADHPDRLRGRASQIDRGVVAIR